MTPDNDDIQQQQPHPSNRSQEEIDALRASDPSAFDEDEGGEAAAAAAKAAKAAGDDPPADPPAAKADDGEKPVKDAKADPPATTDDAGDEGKPRLVPEARLGEVVSERNELRNKLEAYEAAERAREEAVRAALSSRDYAKEIADLDQKWDDGDFEGEFKDFQAARETVVADRERARILAENDQRETQAAADKAERDWAEAKTKFFGEAENLALVQGKVRVAAFSAAIEEAAAAGFDSYEDLLAKAAKLVTPIAAAPVDPHADRKAKDAHAKTLAGSTPPPISGGVGNRAAAGANADLESLPAGKFSSTFTKDQQEEMLGGPGAL